MLKALHAEGASCNIVATKPTRREFKPTYFLDGSANMKKHNFVEGFRNGCIE
jgi:hypothetical protein